MTSEVLGSVAVYRLIPSSISSSVWFVCPTFCRQTVLQCSHESLAPPSPPPPHPPFLVFSLLLLFSCPTFCGQRVLQCRYVPICSLQYFLFCLVNLSVLLWTESVTVSICTSLFPPIFSLLFGQSVRPSVDRECYSVDMYQSMPSSIFSYISPICPSLLH